MTRWLVATLFTAAALLGADNEYLHWTAKEAKNIALASRINGQIGKTADFRIFATDRSFNFKLRATWMTPAVIEALARLEQIGKALTPEETRRLVDAGLAAGDIVIQIAIDPREGSGIVPSDWTALLGARTEKSSDATLGKPSGSRLVRGTSTPSLADVRSLAAVPPRDYSYQLFWVVFPILGDDGKPIFSATDTEAELSVTIQGKTGKIRWPIPAYLRRP